MADIQIKIVETEIKFDQIKQFHKEINIMSNRQIPIMENQTPTMGNQTPIKSTQTPIKSNQSPKSPTCDLLIDVTDDVDVESLRQIFGKESPDNLHRRHPHELRSLLEEAGSEVPRFLLDREDEKHIPPHVVALELLLKRESIFNKYKRISRRRWSLVPIALLSLLCQIVLEVFGGAGAIWGCAELARLRKGGAAHASYDIFTWMAFGVGVVCAFRFAVINCCQPPRDPTFQEELDAIPSFRERARFVAKEPVVFLFSSRGGFFCCCCNSSPPEWDIKRSNSWY